MCEDEEYIKCAHHYFQNVSIKYYWRYQPPDLPIMDKLVVPGPKVPQNLRGGSQNLMVGCVDSLTQTHNVDGPHY